MLRRRRDASPIDQSRESSSPESAGAHPFAIVRNGYSMAEVAAFVSRISTDLSQITPRELRRTQFPVSRRGYDKAEVIAYVNRVAAEIEAELDEAREVARTERIAERAGLKTAPPVIPGEETTWTGGPDPAVAEPAVSDVIWIDVDDLPAIPAEPPNAAPATEAVPTPLEHDIFDPVPEPAPVAQPTPPPAPPQPTPPQPDLVSAAGEITDLLRAAHDNALRLRTQAEADVRNTVEAAQVEVESQTRSQLRDLADQRDITERENARILHDAELESLEIRQRALQDAAAARAAAAAVLAQAKAEIEAVKAIARHNLAEIDAAREEAMLRSREMLSLGRGMLSSVIDLDRECDARLRQSRQLVEDVLRSPGV